MWPGGVTFGVIGSSFLLERCQIVGWTAMENLAALCAALFRYLRKTWGGGRITAPPAVRGLKLSIFHSAHGEQWWVVESSKPSSTGVLKWMEWTFFSVCKKSLAKSKGSQTWRAIWWFILNWPSVVRAPAVRVSTNRIKCRRWKSFPETAGFARPRSRCTFVQSHGPESTGIHLV